MFKTFVSLAVFIALVVMVSGAVLIFSPQTAKAITSPLLVSDEGGYTDCGFRLDGACGWNWYK